MINEIIYYVDELANMMLEGYEPLTLPDKEASQKRDKRKWKKDIQKLIEWAAHPTTGMDRLAIALACFRDMSLVDNLEEKWDNLEECRAQLVDLYNTVTPNPFRI